MAARVPEVEAPRRGRSNHRRSQSASLDGPASGLGLLSAARHARFGEVQDAFVLRPQVSTLRGKPTVY